MTEVHPPSATVAETRRRRHGLRLVVFGLIPLLALLCLVESMVRVSDLDQPLAGSIFFGHPSDKDPIHRADAELFYVLKPDIQETWQGGQVTTNELGLRSGPLAAKKPYEFRILSLGESSTFGACVDDDQTYSAQLETLLNANSERDRFRVINAGVSGYTSFQSLTYLRNKGLALQPDLVLFYHEQNDFLPTAFADHEIHSSRIQAWHRTLADYSATYRVLSNAVARRRIESLRQQDSAEIPENEFPADGMEQLNGSRQRARVPPVERRRNLQRLVDLCDSHGIRLVIMHPSYAGSVRHDCELTEFCRASGAVMFETFDALHPPEKTPRALFVDECHPNPDGHRSLAMALQKFLIARDLLPRQ